METPKTIPPKSRPILLAGFKGRQLQCAKTNHEQTKPDNQRPCDLASDCCLTPSEQFSAISWPEKSTFQ